ncbi:hypothetical protein EVAR_2787_1 [Eumeta japonica]|uniref:Uncharacterized protein n=1 Tax=Eumeta variegata TaxID=151549 RepID=A0A4C1T2A0_EUMVA|nr:hypothetical protein EVAR_2787_1 [Eumeta japonica]
MISLNRNSCECCFRSLTNISLIYIYISKVRRFVVLYTECVQYACDTVIPRKCSVRRLKLPWWSPDLEGLKKDANTKKRRIRNAASSRRPYVVEESVRAKEAYKRAAANLHTTSWKQFFTAQDRESIWDDAYRVIRDTGKNREDVLLINDSGQTCNPHESAVLLANTFFPDDQVDTDNPYHTELRRRTDGSVCPPETLDISSEMDLPLERDGAFACGLASSWEHFKFIFLSYHEEVKRIDKF